MAAEGSTASLTVAYYALIGVLISAGVALLVGAITNVYNFWHLSWKKEQWIKDKKETAYFGCLKCLHESRIITGTNEEGQIYIEKWFFDGRMDTLKFAVPWLTMIASYSPGITRLEIEKVRDELDGLIKKVQDSEVILVPVTKPDGTRPMIDAKLDQGLAAAVEKAMKVVTEYSKTELLKANT